MGVFMKNLFRRLLTWVTAVLMVLVLFPTAVTKAEAGEATDISASLTSAEIIGVSQNTDGSYSVFKNTPYSVSLRFDENGNQSNIQFTSDMKCTLPSGLFPDQTGSFSMTITYLGKDYVVDGNTWSVSNNVLTVYLNTEDANYSKLTSVNNAWFKLSFTGIKFDESKKINWNANTSTTVNLDNNGSVYVSKTGTYSAKDNKINYVLTVTSTGYNSTVVVADTISGSALTYDRNAVSDNGTGTKKDNDNGFSYTFTEMLDKEVRTIKYSASVDISKISDNGTAEQTGNTVKVSSKEHPGNTVNQDMNHQIHYSTISKIAGSITDGGSDKKIIPWTITYNSEMLVSVAGKIISDTIADDSKSIMKYTGAGIHVVRTDKNGNSNSYDITWADLEKSSESLWKYKIPAQDTGVYSYVITYNTEVNTASLVADKTVNNIISDGSDKKTSSTTIIADKDQKIGVTKKATDCTSDIISWEVTLTVPAKGLDTASVIDTYPLNKDLKFQDTLNSTIEITDDAGNELTDVFYDIDTSNSQKAVINFYKDTEHKLSGIAGTGTVRTIKIAMTTKNDANWIKKAEENDFSYLKQHTNSVEFTGNGTSVSTTASATPTKVTITKMGCTNDTKTESVYPVGTASDGMPYYKYVITVNGIDRSQDLVINDDFDTTNLEVYNKPASTQYYNDSDANLVYAGNQYSQDSLLGTANVESTNTGAKFTLSKASIQDASKGDYYKIIFYLKVINSTRLDALKQSSISAEDHNVVLSDTASYGSASHSFNSIYKYDGLTKTLLNENDLTGDSPIAKYQLVINADGEKLSSGDTLIVTDTFSSSLCIDYSSIKIEPNVNVTYDVNGNTTVFIIPDKTKTVITYSARVVGATGKVDISNTAEVAGFTQDSIATAKVTNSGTGGGSNLSINILKYQTGNMNIKLAGAVFALQKYENSKWVDVIDQLTQKVATFKTGENGTVTVFGNADTNKWVLEKGIKYRLKETTAPSTYKMDGDGTYEFTIGDVADHDKNIYFDGDTIKIGNSVETTSATVTKAWADNSDAEGFRPATVDLQLQKRIGDGTPEDVTDKKVTLSAANKAADDSNTWTYTFTDLPKYEGGQEITYSVRETSTDSHYTADTDNTDLTVTNSRELEKITVSGIKTWNDAGNEDARPADGIVIHLYANNNKIADKTVTKDDSTGVYSWAYSFGELQKYVDGKEIQYTIKEDDVNNYTSVPSGMNVTNTYAPGSTSITVSKKWVDLSDAYETRPKSIQVQLYADDNAYGEPVTLTGSSEMPWSYTWTTLDKTHNGKDINYTVKEVNVPNGYLNSVKVGEKSNDYVIENTRTTGNLIIKKSFDGDNITEDDKNNLTFEVKGPNNYDEVFKYGTDFDKDGTLTIKNLAAGDYTVTETNPNINGYDVTVTTSVNNESGSTASVSANTTQEVEIKDSYTKLIGNLVIKKSFDGDNITDEDKANLKFEITKPDGTTQTVAYSEFTDGKYTLTDVPTGKYSVREVNPEITGYDVTVTTTVDGKEGNETTLALHATSEIDIKDTYQKPTTPVTPDRPTTPTTNDRNERPSTPNTGDQTNAAGAAGALAFSMLLAGFAFFFRRKYSD